MARLKYLYFLLISFFICIIPHAYSLEGVTDPAKIPAENFFKENTAFSYRISPDGKQLAFIRKYTQHYNIVITDLEKFTEVHNFAVSKNIPDQLTWISNSRLVFGLSGVIYSVNHDGADLRVLISNLYDKDKVKGYRSFINNLRYWSLLKRPNGTEEDVLFLSYNSDGHANIHKVNIYTGEKTDLYDADKLEADGLYTDRDGKVVLVEKVKKEQHSFYRLIDNDMKLASLDISNQSYPLNYDAKSYLNRTVVVHEIGFDKDIMYISEKTSGDRYQLVKYNYITNQKEVIGSDPIYDVGSPDENVSFHYDIKNRKLVGFSYNADKRKTVWLDDRFKKYQERLDRTYPGKINQIYDWNETTDKLLVISYDAKTKGKIIVFDPVKNRNIVQTDYSDILTPEKMKDTEIYKYKTVDGTAITAYVTPPAATAEADKKWPLIVMPHGGPFSRSYYGYSGHMQYFSTRGYAVFEPNFRGSTGYGANHLTAGRHQIADLMISDIADGVRALVNENKVDPTQVYILGFSYGGYAAIMSAIKYPELYSAAVSAAAPLELNDQLKHYKKEENWFAYEFWQDLIGTKEKGKKYIETISPYHQVEKIKIPLLIFHGDQDEVVPKQQAENFKKLAEKKNLNIPVRIIQSEGHGWNLVSSNTYFVEKSVELFRANKKATP